MTAEDFFLVIQCAGAIAAPSNIAWAETAWGKLVWLSVGTFLLHGLVT